jgi:VCBS repeat protein/type IX secretion system substrate protein
MGSTSALLFVFAILLVQVNAQDYSFRETTIATNKVNYKGVSVGDLNGDNWQDIVLSNNDEYNIQVYLNQGNGDFKGTPDYTYDMDAFPTRSVLIKANNDKHLDLAVVEYYHKRVAVFLGNGDGTFVPHGHTDSTLEEDPDFIVAFHSDGDAFLDLAISNTGGNSFTLYRGNGDGSFKSPEVVESFGRTDKIAAGDIDNDGDIDLVLGNSGGEQIAFHYNENGQFSTYELGSMSGAGHKISIGDVNGDKLNDMVAAISNYDTNTLIVQLAKPGGGFEVSQVITPGKYPTDLFIADADDDLDLDLFTANSDGIYIYFNDGTGTYTLKHTHSTGGYHLRDFFVADLNNDGRPDFILTADEGARVFVSTGGPSEVHDVLSADTYLLYQNYPNPVSGFTSISVKSQVSGTLSIDMYALDGTLLQHVVSRDISPGSSTYTMDLSALGTGVYFYRANLNGQVQQRMLMVLH